MNLKFKGKRIAGILTVVPSNVSRFDDEVQNYSFSTESTMKLKRIMGFNEHRIVSGNTCVSDLCIFGLRYLFDRGLLDKSEIDALVLVTQSPDHFLPPTSCIIQGKLGLKQDMICLDINQGCAGYEVGLIQAFILLEQDSINKVVVLNADVLSRKTSRQDRNSFPLIGDGAAITVVEKGDYNSTIYANIKTDGSRYEALIIPAGGFRQPSTIETAIPLDDGSGNIRSLDNLYMNGTAIFNFVMESVPSMIKDLIAWGGVDMESIDYFMFHQPNKFMINKIAEKLRVPYEKMPGNVVEHFGNASGVTVPTAICLNIADDLLRGEKNVCLAGFGVGLAWSSILLKMGNLAFCNFIDYYE